MSLGNNIRYDSIVLGFLRENATDKEQADNRQSTAAVLSSGSPEQSPSMYACVCMCACVGGGGGGGGDVIKFSSETDVMKVSR